MTTKTPILVLAVALTLAGCTTTPTFEEGPDAEVTYDGLTRMRGTAMDAVWARRDIDLTSYRKVMFTDVEFEYRPVSGPVGGREGAPMSSMRRSSQTEFKIGPNTKVGFEEVIQEAMFEVLDDSDKYEVTTEAGPDVLLVQAGLLDVVSRVPPETISRGSIYIADVGEATLVLVLRDSVSNAVFVRAVDRRAAESGGQELRESNSVNNRAEVRRLGRRWATLLRKGLEDLLTEPLT